MPVIVLSTLYSISLLTHVSDDLILMDFNHNIPSFLAPKSVFICQGVFLCAGIEEPSIVKHSWGLLSFPLLVRLMDVCITQAVHML